MRASEQAMPATMLVAGSATGPVLKLSQPLNAWGGLDPETGVIIHHSHPQRGQSLAGRVLVMQESRGSGTNAQVFAQAWANGKGPLAVVLALPDFVLCVGAVVSNELYGVQCPVVVLDSRGYDALGDGDVVTISADDDGARVTFPRHISSLRPPEVQAEHPRR
jgi:predicted aconitase with swiveling domain